MPQIPEPVLVGIECGGTRTVALAVDGALQPVDRITAGPANLRLRSDAELETHFRAIADRFPVPAAVGVGMAGVRGAADCARLSGILARVWPGVPLRVDHDLESALAAATLPRRTRRTDPNPVARVVILSGTGSCCYGRNTAGKVAKVGGWGHLLGDRGSAHDIALTALRLSAGALDRTGRWGDFGRRALHRLQLTEPDDLIAWLQSAGKADVAALAPEVFAAARARDVAAREAIGRATADLGADADACAARLAGRGDPVEFHFAGSVLLRQPSLARAISANLRGRWPQARCLPLPRESVWGAVVLALGALRDSRPSNPPSARQRPVAQPSPVPQATAPSPTEARNPRSLDLDRMPVEAAIRMFLDEDAGIPGVIAAHSGELARLIRRAVRCLESGGRLFYVGAGTSGRLGVLDASECPPTFRSPPEWVQGIMAGGERALHSAVEGAEDDLDGGGRAVAARAVGPKDLVIGLAASGRTPFVWGALQAARQAGAATGLVCCNPHLRFARAMRPDFVIALDLGPELLTGSTRLKSGTATKLALNILTTLTMVRLGKVLGNLMIDLNPSNAKLRDRATRIVVELTGRDPETARSTLEKQGWIVADAVRALGRKPRR